ncbi:hypothetical protein WG66_012008, partial [Moniliophthora roreri]
MLVGNLIFSCKPNFYAEALQITHSLRCQLSTFPVSRSFCSYLHCTCNGSTFSPPVIPAKGPSKLDRFVAR